MATSRPSAVIEHEDLPLCQFPSKPVCLAYGSAQKLLAIGCEDKKILILDGKNCIEHQTDEAVHLMSFMTVKNKDCLLTISKKSRNVFFWSKEKCILRQQLIHEPIVLTWLPAHSTYLFGTKRGTVQIVKVEEVTDDKIELQAIKQAAVRIIIEYSTPGEIVALVEQPTREAETVNNSHNILVVFSSGLCAIWDWKKKKTQSENSNANPKLAATTPLYAWWSDETSCFVAYNNGTIWSYEYENQNLVEKERYTLGGSKDDTPIRKFQCISSTRPRLVYTGGSSSVPDGSKDSHIVSSFTLPDNDMPILPFNDEVVDILCLPLEEESPVIAVLTRSELVMINLNDEKAKEIECGSSKIKRYPRFTNFHGYPHFTSQVTSLQHCGSCSKELFKAIYSPAEVQSMPELIVTGHKDGSVYLWLLYYDKAKNVTLLKLPLVIYTAQYFKNTKAGDQKQMDITLTKMTTSQQCLLVVNSSGHMLLYQLHSYSNDKPQSQEIVLKDYQDDAQPNPIKTPPPHFRPCSWQSRVQLLQHFSCHYQKESTKQPVPVTITCADYHEQMKMLAVGTDRGVIVLDTQTNNLIQVIGSEKKLMRLSGCKDSSTSSESECKVTELQIVIVHVPKKQPEVSLWVGTANGSVGALLVNRKNDRAVLKLLKTGKGKQTNSSVVSIHYLEQKADGGKTTTDSTVVVTTQKDIQIFTYQNTGIVKTYTCNSAETILRSGLVCDESGAQYVITLTRKKDIAAYSIPDLSLIDKIKKSDATLLSGGGGCHAVIYSDKKLQLVNIRTIS